MSVPNNVYESLSQNGLSFLFKKPRPGRGGEISCCRLNPKKWVTITTPTYYDGMTHEEARTAWINYCRGLAEYDRRSNG